MANRKLPVRSPTSRGRHDQERNPSPTQVKTWYRALSPEDKNDVFGGAFIMFAEIILTLIYLFDDSGSSQGRAAAAIYFTLACCLLILVLRRSEIKEMFRNTLDVTRGLTADPVALTDAFWVAATLGAIILVFFVVSPETLGGSEVRVTAAAFVGATPLVKSLVDSLRRRY